MVDARGLRMGLDVGSTTAKIILLDSDGKIIHSDYRRHNAAIGPTLASMLRDCLEKSGDEQVSVAVTGSAGLGLSERHGLPFVQEVISSAEAMRKRYPSVRTLIDVGGEDSKMIFFDDRMRVDIRMNGNCAGGTGAFIDQMATILNVPVSELDTLASCQGTRHKIASRCGVFAKTDVQNLISRKVPPHEIAASIFHAMAIQTVSTLSRGCEARPKVAFCGGPFTFLPSLKVSFREVLGLAKDYVLDLDEPEYIPALGTALYDHVSRLEIGIGELVTRIESGAGSDLDSNRLDPLFRDGSELAEWSGTRLTRVERDGSYEGGKCYLGIDSGSTTTKIVLIDNSGKILFSHYGRNKGDPIESARTGLSELASSMRPEIAGAASTGYGEELMKAAFGLDHSAVETLAHFRAAREFLPDVSFVLDIGGQDMKALFVRDGVVNDVELNEACSSGCGSFLETFAGNLGLDIASFASEACRSRSPYDLGTRCTVFMNSKVKQALREGASVGDISAGLAVSVVKNCLYKVLKIKDQEVLGDRIVVQGGTFRNPAVHRAFELVLGKRVICPDIPELMGAYGAALLAMENAPKEGSTFVGLTDIEGASSFDRSSIRCKGCSNSCEVTKMTFASGKVYYSGNRCERIFINRGRTAYVGANLAEEKLSMLFDRKGEIPSPRGTIGIPRVLNIFDNYPFWHALMTGSGFKVVLSPPSTHSVEERGSKNVMSESICFPAKLATGHVATLSGMGVDRIYYPVVVFERSDHRGALNSFNCPVVTGYPDVLASTLNIPIDRIAVSFKDVKLLERSCRKYLSGLGVPKEVFEAAFASAILAQNEYRKAVALRADEIVRGARKRGNIVVLLLGRPYHIDSLINHKLTEMITQLGADVITEDSIPQGLLDDMHVLTQWEYPNRIYNAVRWASSKDNVEVVQLNSFGCGPDALVYDEAHSMLQAAGKGHTLIRIDEVSSPGSIRLRLRSMFGSLENRVARQSGPRKSTPVYSSGDRNRRILVPFFSNFFSPFLEAAAKAVGVDIETLPPPDRESVENGLKYCNNDICYPAIVTIGDLIKAVRSGRYDRSGIALGITQTGGQCRASSYVSLLKKAVIDSGHGDIPVVAVTLAGSNLNDQPGLKIDKLKLLRRVVHGALYADSLMMMYNSTAPREIEEGTAHALLEKYIARGVGTLIDQRHESLPEVLEEAVAEFNMVKVTDRQVPTVGIVGEIYVKYNAFGNFGVVDHLIRNGIEPVVPPIFDFFCQELYNPRFSALASTKRRTLKFYLTYPAEWYVNSHLRRYGGIRNQYIRCRKEHKLKDLASDAGKIVSLAAQFGEGWLIPAEISSFANDGINNVLCLQPFGCISNHIIGKGIENALKRAHPELNILYLDMDAGSSEVNLYNRLNFLMRSSREDLERKEGIKA